jgi:hypothetical protein
MQFYASRAHTTSVSQVREKPPSLGIRVRSCPALRLTPSPSRHNSPRFSPPAFASPTPSYPRPCLCCGVMSGEADFAIDRSKAGGRKSYCKACDRKRGRAYYETRNDELTRDA